MKQGEGAKEAIKAQKGIPVVKPEASCLLDQPTPTDLPTPMTSTNVKSVSSPIVLSQTSPLILSKQLEQLQRSVSTPGLSEDEMDAKLLSSFGHLPSNEQDVMITRLESLVCALKDIKQPSIVNALPAVSRFSGQNLSLCDKGPKNKGLPSSKRPCHPLEPTVIVKRASLWSNVSVPMDNLGLGAITRL